MNWIFDPADLADFKIPNLNRPTCAIALSEVGDYTSSLLTPEQDMLTTMTAERRRNTFSSGRHCVRMAQRGLALEPQAIGRNDRVPVWPTGFGSISHSETFAGAAISPADVSLGIDLEELERVDEPLWRVIFTVQERRELDKLSASIGFSAKEAGYKAIFPIGQKFINFHDAEIDIDQSSQTFRIRYLGAHAPNKALERGRGFYQIAHNHVLTYFEIDQCKH